MSENITGIREFQNMLAQVGKVPAKAMTAATKKAAMVVRQDARANAPVQKGILRRSIKLKVEKRRTGKKIYQVKFVGGDELVRYTKGGKRYFYPASQEYGFRKLSGGKQAGKHFMKNSMRSRGQLLQSIIDDLANSLRSLGM